MIEKAELLAAGYQRRSVLDTVLFEKNIADEDGRILFVLRFVEWDFRRHMPPDIAADHRWRPEAFFHLGPRRQVRVIYRAVNETTVLEVESLFLQTAAALRAVPDPGDAAD